MLTMGALAVMVQPAAVPVARLSLMVKQRQAMLLVMFQPTAVAVIRLAMLHTTTTLWPQPSALASKWMARDERCDLMIVCRVRLRAHARFRWHGGLPHICCGVTTVIPIFILFART